MDLLTQQSPTLELFGRGALLLVLLWGLVWLVLGAFYPLMGASPVAPPVTRALAEAVRRVKTTLLLELLAAFATALIAGFVWWFLRYLERVSVVLHDARRSDLRQLGAMALGVVLFALVRCWRDVAMSYAMGSGRAPLAAAGASLGALVRMPLRTLGTGLWWLVLSWVPALALGLLVHQVEWRRAIDWVVITALVQQVALWWGYHCRMKWFVHLGDRVVRGR